MIEFTKTPKGYTWYVTHIEIPNAVIHKKYRNLTLLTSRQDPSIPTYLEVDGQLHEPSVPIPLGASMVYIMYEGVPYVAQLPATA